MMIYKAIAIFVVQYSGMAQTKRSAKDLKRFVEERQGLNGGTFTALLASETVSVRINNKPFNDYAYINGVFTAPIHGER